MAEQQQQQRQRQQREEEEFDGYHDDRRIGTKSAAKIELLGPATPLSIPIFATSTFVLESAEHGAALSNLEEGTYEPGEFDDGGELVDHAERFRGGPKPSRSPYIYSRWGNPTLDATSRAIARLEDGGDAILTASGMGAISTTLFALLKQGDHVVAPRSVYGGTMEVFSKMLPRFGVEVTFVEASSSQEYQEAIRNDGSTKLIYAETPANPTLALVDLEAIVSHLKKHNNTTAVTVVDSTFASPFHQNPLELGFDVVIHSCTKYLGGHSDLTAGCIVTSNSKRGRELRDKCWHQLKLFGAVASPFDSFLLLRGTKTLAVRVGRQSRSALELAQYLEAHPLIEKVHYPGLPSHPQHQLAQRQMKRGYGAMMAFEVKGGKDAGKVFIESLKLITLAVSLGGVESLASHPASMTHVMLTPQQRAAAGVSEGLIRFSVGLEDSRDLRDDLDTALKRVEALLNNKQQ